MSWRRPRVQLARCLRCAPVANLPIASIVRQPHTDPAPLALLACRYDHGIISSDFVHTAQHCRW